MPSDTAAPRICPNVRTSIGSPWPSPYPRLYFVASAAAGAIRQAHARRKRALLLKRMDASGAQTSDDLGSSKDFQHVYLNAVECTRETKAHTRAAIHRLMPHAAQVGGRGPQHNREPMRRVSRLAIGYRGPTSTLTIVPKSSIPSNALFLRLHIAANRDAPNQFLAALSFAWRGPNLPYRSVVWCGYSMSMVASRSLAASGTRCP